ncbi:PDZ domain-containing protein [Halovulum dunhuangense]|uniref:PDZ domain-containing protein n=1 Tax=Halovulum dunhuangense TaxID=1505036 RepID=A0A849L0L0_9RHOB|nr:trypsin-like peptidase domain-containing protein [Halovulum dunhuangense]NNU79804.1 PDZ domain-containing protein [Halovulum dunhuangense]
MTRLLLTVALILGLSVAPVASAQERVPASREEITLSYAPVVRQTVPAVVNIYASRLVPTRVSPFAGDPFFEQFFGNRTVPRVQNALGSGVILGEDGIVVSNFHVVGDATEIRVVLSDRREFDARVLLADEARDIAVLQIEADVPLPFLEFADSDAAEVGDLVLAIGNPFGVGQTVTSGIVSGLARTLASEATAQAYYIQTDAAINPGNSGGALVDMQGRLLGVNTAILSRSGGSQGIGFAIPANLVRAYVEQARQGGGRLVPPWSGMLAQTVETDLAAALGLTLPEGILVSDLHPESPFAAAGLRPGDVVLSVDGLPVHSMSELDYRLLTRKEKTARITWLRDGQKRTAEVAIIAPPESPPRDPRQVGGSGPLAGLAVETVNPAVIAERGLPLDAQGVIVAEAPGVAGRIGLRPGDILLAIDGREIRTTREAVALASRLSGGAELLLLREGRRLALRFRG